MKTHVCQVDGRECELTASYYGTLDSLVIAVRRLNELLICDRCRSAEGHTKALKGVRFGKHERRILLTAEPPDAKHSIVPPDGVGRSANETNRRAIRRLSEAGLLSLSKERVKRQIGPTKWDTRTYHMRTVRLTPLGQILVDRVGSDLASGKGIHWPQHQPDLLSKVRLKGDELIAVFERRLSEFVAKKNDSIGENSVLN